MSIISEIHKDLEQGAVRLITEHRDRLMSEAVRLCGDMTSAEDLVSCTFAKAIRNIGSYKVDDNFFGWLKTIMVNIHRNNIRGSVARGTTPTDPLELEALSAEDWSSDEQILQNSDNEALRAALERLDPKYKQVVSMHYFSELPVKSIATLLKLPVGTVLWRLNIARKILAKDLSEKLGKKKPLAILVAAILGVGALFGAWQAGEAIIEAMKPPTTENNQTTLTTTKEKSKMNTLKRITLAATAAASVMSMSAPAEVPEPTPTDYGWTRSYTQDGREFVVTAYTKPGTYTYTVEPGVTAIDYLVVGGGGSGGSGKAAGGGGAGGYLEANNVSVEGITSLSITVGAGGEGLAKGNKPGFTGKDSELTGLAQTVTALGGGNGARGESAEAGGDGGSGGGGSGYAGEADKDFPGGKAKDSAQGYNGCPGIRHDEGGKKRYGGGGGGAGGPGGEEGWETDFAKRPKGGPGKASSITGEEVVYAFGGDGVYETDYSSSPTTPGSGSSAAANVVAAQDGIVVIRYEVKKSVQLTVTPDAGVQVALNDGAYADSIDESVQSGDNIKLAAKGASDAMVFTWKDLPDGAETSDDTKTVSFTMPAESLSISVEGKATTMWNLAVSATEGGSVEGTESGTYVDNFEVTLTAVPEENYDFVGWTVNGESDSKDPTLAFHLTFDTTVVANFKVKAKYTLTITPSDYGTITGNEGTEFYDGAKVTLTATPNMGLKFVGWGDDAADFGNEETIEITMDANKTVSAKFGYALTIKNSPYGTITANPEGTIFEAGSTVGLTATPAEGCAFLEWADDATGDNATTVVTMDQDRTVSAAFKDDQGRSRYTWGWAGDVRDEKGHVTGFVSVYTQPGEHTYVVPQGVRKIDYLVVAGGGSGGVGSGAGGGGAGGYLEATEVSVKSGTELAITVGAGGAKPEPRGNTGSDSKLLGIAEDIVALGGGFGGAGGTTSNLDGGDGGSGGGGGGYANNPDTYIPGGKTKDSAQGYNGCPGYRGPDVVDDSGSKQRFRYGAGGGGAGGPGGAEGWESDDTKRMAGGPGKASSITGEEVVYAIGGNGTLNDGYSASPTTPGSGSSASKDGIAGCDGIVIIRYAPRKPGLAIMFY